MCRSRRELSNEYLLAKIGFDTAENQPCKVWPLSVYRSPRFAFKCSYAKIKGQSVDVLKDPVRVDSRVGYVSRLDLVSRRARAQTMRAAETPSALILGFIFKSCWPLGLEPRFCRFRIASQVFRNEKFASAGSIARETERYDSLRTPMEFTCGLFHHFCWKLRSRTLARRANLAC